jgi:hypothetical protein
MKNLTIIILSLLLGGVIGWLIKPCNCPDPLHIVTTDTVYQDTGTHTVTIKPKYYKVIESKIDTFMYEVDTNAILAEYFKTKMFDTTIVDDSSTYINVRGAIYMNDLLYLRTDYSNKRATKVINNIKNPVKRNSIDLGASLSLDNVYLDMMYQRDKNGFKLSYSPIDKAILVGYSRKVLEW